jgi:hypothetical protein
LNGKESPETLPAWWFGHCWEHLQIIVPDMVEHQILALWMMDDGKLPPQEIFKHMALHETLVI